MGSAEVLALAKQFYSTHQLSAADANTIQCKVPRGYTSVPIPQGTGENYAGLFTVDLPQGVKAGSEYSITVRRLSTKRGVFKAPPPPPPPPLPPPPIKLAGEAEATAPPGTRAVNEHFMRNWRYIVGTFAVRIPVTTPKVMRPFEENTLSILTWRLSQMKPGNRWIPVLERYLGYIRGRVKGVGGDPGSIKPSPWGSYGPPGKGGHGPGHGHGGEHGHEHRLESTGKVTAVIYDRFGDFEGFHLLTEWGHERCYYSREAEIEALVRYAWLERVVVEVVSDRYCPDRPVNLILRRAPPQPRRPD